MDFYVSPHGSDQWSGTKSQPDAGGEDGPFATIGHARDVIRALKQTGRLSGSVTVWLREGRYPLTAPLLFGPEDSGPITYAAYLGEKPIVDGGRRINGWRLEQVGSVTCWVADLPEVAAGRWYFRQLFVGGQRRPRPRLPKEGFYWIRDLVPTLDLASWTFSEQTLFAGADSFICFPGDIQPWQNLRDVDVVALHWWIEERLPIMSFDEVTGKVTSSRRSMCALRDDASPRYARYYVENVFEALSEPGEWYLDRHAGKLYYLPLPGEDPHTTEVFAPFLEQLLILRGQPEGGRFVEFLRFAGVRFEHSEWRQPEGWHILFDLDHAPFSPQPGVELAAAFQGACHVPGSVFLEGARYCALEDCHVAHIGGYGVEIAEGCLGNRIVGNTISDMGAGGVKLYGSRAGGPRSRRTGHTYLADNHIHAGGRVFPSALGILMIHTDGNEVAHNHIHDMFYSGISCGWVWRYTENVSKDNRIEFNHIHDLGQGLLNDMGGIYVLGIQPGTVVRGNLIHDVTACNYGGWGIYLDEASSYVLVENNIVYNTKSHAFHQHYGRENIIRNNIFAFGERGQVALGRGEAHNSFTFERNVVILDNQPLFVARPGCHLEERHFISDLNLFWNVSGDPIISGNVQGKEDAGHGFNPVLTLDDLARLGYDRHSIVADPRCRDLASRDFTLAGDSPAFALGFQHIDLSAVGPRPRPGREGMVS